MDILWEPESGCCTECGAGGDCVRRFTTGRHHRVFCFECWNRDQDGTIVSSLEWTDSESIVFRYPDAEPEFAAFPPI